MTATAIENVKYFTIPTKKERRYHSITYWIVSDLDCPKGRQLLLNALNHLVRF